MSSPPPDDKNHPHPLDVPKYAGVKQEDLRQVGSLISPECTELKGKYDACFMDWYANEFLQGTSKPDMVPCEDLFKCYKKCVELGIKRLNIPTEPPPSCPP